MDVTSKKFQDQLAKEVQKITGEPKATTKETKVTKQKIEDTLEDKTLNLTSHEKSLILSALEAKRTLALANHFKDAYKIEHEDQIDFFAGCAKDLIKDINIIISKIEKAW